MDDRLVSESTTIDAPPAVVFAIVADPRQHPRIDGSGSVRGIITGPDRLAKGATFGVSMKLFGLPYKIRNRVVEYEQDRRIAWIRAPPSSSLSGVSPIAAATTGGPATNICAVPRTITETWDATRYASPVFAGLRALGFPERNREGISGTLVRLRLAAEADQAAPL